MWEFMLVTLIHCVCTCVGTSLAGCRFFRLCLLFSQQKLSVDYGWESRWFIGLFSCVLLCQYAPKTIIRWQWQSEGCMVTQTDRSLLCHGQSFLSLTLASLVCVCRSILIDHRWFQCWFAFLDLMCVWGDVCSSHSSTVCVCVCIGRYLGSLACCRFFRLCLLFSHQKLSVWTMDLWVGYSLVCFCVCCCCNIPILTDCRGKVFIESVSVSRARVFSVRHLLFYRLFHDCTSFRTWLEVHLCHISFSLAPSLGSASSLAFLLLT